MTLSFTQTMFGKPNYFIERIWRTLPRNLQYHRGLYLAGHVGKFGRQWEGRGIYSLIDKPHTIREDHKDRWGPGCDIHFVINNRTGNRYQFAPVTKCISVQEFDITRDRYDESYDERTGWQKHAVYVDGRELGLHEIPILAMNDGFDSVEDFFKYFSGDYIGKIIHWTDLKY